MHCYRCHGEMRKTDREQVLVDRCTQCGGIWLDAGELEMLEKGAGLERAALMQQARHELLEEARRMVSVIGLCPKCERGKLSQVKKRGVEIDVCNHCHGLFFDEGELDRVLEEKTDSLFASLLAVIRG